MTEQTTADYRKTARACAHQCNWSGAAEALSLAIEHYPRGDRPSQMAERDIEMMTATRDSYRSMEKN